MSVKTTISNIWASHRLLIIVTGIVILGIFLLVMQSNAIRDLKNQVKMKDNNISALHDTVRVSQDKQKQAEYSRQTFVVQSADEVKKLSADLFNEINAIKGQLKSIEKANVVIPSNNVPIIVTNPSPHIWNFKYDSTFSVGNYERFNGFIDTENPFNSRRTSGEIGIALVTGIQNENGQPRIFVKSKFPNFTVTSLEGAIIDKNYFNTSQAAKTPLFTISAHVGQNIFTYNYKDKSLRFFEPEVNGAVGLSLNLTKLLSKK